ncbi:uncharacterized protein LOC113871604 [Abrus precatorius]|uniref:Uncharacterized protein LOC113871604 n=1 Tax=Abrus precatorius TaxID=3816 RepID=A0A8B8M9M3_ABRPR|nr:uncharacterized protein LOC113871604 [Abrus precatorius]
MVREGVVLGHLISERGIQVDKAKIDVISSLPYPASVWEVRSFLRHAGFYRRFIRDFNTIALPLSHLLQKDVPFLFTNSCKEAFEELRRRLTTTHIMQPLDWKFSFELMCDTSDFALGAVLSQRVGKFSHVISYASRTLDAAQINYTATEKELLAIVFALDKFRSHLLGSKITVFTDHVALKFLLKKPYAKPRLIKWMLLLQEFNIDIKDKSDVLNQVADHLSRIEGTIDRLLICDSFPDDYLFALYSIESVPWFADIVNYLVTVIVPPDASRSQVDKLKSIDFMGLFLVFAGYSYILLTVDYVSRWVEEKATKTNDSKVVSNFLYTHIFCRFSVPKTVISDQGSHFCNMTIAALLQKYGVTHRVATPYHPQTNGQAERTAYRTPLGMSPFQVVFGKACHLPVEIEYRSYWAVKSCNLTLEQARIERKLQLQELEEIRLQAYENSRLYKEKVRRFHDTHILRKEFFVGEKVLLFNFRLKLIAFEIQDEATSKAFKVNGHQLKLFWESKPVESAQNIVDLSLVESTLMEDVST